MSVCADQRGGWCSLSARDRGPGFSEEGLAWRFEPFWTTKGGRHLGLGLVLAREVVEAQGGALAVGLVRGGGALAELAFPALDETASRRGHGAPHALAAPHHASSPGLVPSPWALLAQLSARASPS